MIEQTRGLSFVRWHVDSGQTRFHIPFEYLAREHVSAVTQQDEERFQCPLTWIDDTTIEITPHHAPPYVLIVRRTTPVDREWVEYRDGARLPARDLRHSFRQLLYAHQEWLEGSAVRSGGGGGSRPPGSGGDFDDLNDLIDKIIRSPALKDLLTEIDPIERSPLLQTLISKQHLIDANGHVLLEELARSARFVDARREFAHKISKAEHTLTLLDEGYRVTAMELTDLFARVETHETSTKAQYLELNEAIADEASARVSSITDLHTQMVSADEAVSEAVNTRIASVETTAGQARALLGEQLQAQIAEGDSLVSGALNERVNTVEATADAALAQAVTTLNAQIADNGQVLSDAFNERVDSVEAEAESALASTKTLLMAQIADSNAAMQALVSTRVDAQEAATIAQTKVQAFKDGHFALMQQEFNVVAGQHAGMYGQWQANYSVKINAGKVNGKPVIAGIALSANPETGSDVIVMADRFAVVPPNYSPDTQPKIPFVVGQVNGVNTVGIQGQLLVDGSITAHKITVNALSAVTANAGTINGGTFKTHTLDADGNVINPTEFRAEISNVGDWPLWIGSGAKTANNAVVWIDRQGNAEFKGKIKAQNVVGQFQSATAVDWNGAVPIQNEMKTIHVFSLAPPLAIGESHIPSMTLTLRLNEQGAGLRVLLEQKQGSVWVPLTEWESGGVTAKSTLEGGFFGGGGMHSHSFSAGTIYGNTSSVSTPAISIPAHSHWVTTTVFAKVATIAAVGNPVNTATEFRVRAESTSNVNVVNISGFVFGIR